MNRAHALAREQLREIAEASSGGVEIIQQAVDESGLFLTFEVSLLFQGADRSPSGLPIKARERFLIRVPTSFPFVRPDVLVSHRRFAGFPHVQWGRYICLYRSSSDWSAEGGMYGLVERLDGWIRDAALDRLDPDDAPLHPPVAYARSGRLVVPVADTPTLAADVWFGFAALRERANRTEIFDWIPLEGEAPEAFAAAVLLSRPLPFEYPRKVSDMTKELEGHGIDYALLVRLLASLALRTPLGTPFLVAIGAPMRRVDLGGPLLQHLALWEIDSDAADQLRRLNAFFLDDPRFAEMGEDAKSKVVEWSVHADVGWCEVREMRPAVTRRRDQGTSISWFHGRTVHIWGCGAIGTHVAESIVRAGVRRIVLCDVGRVVPGILVRQAFEDDDIGRPKAQALAAKLRRIEPDLDVVPWVGDLLRRLDEPDVLNESDVVLDCTASAAVRLKLEHTLRAVANTSPIASLAVSYNAQAAIATLASDAHAGGPADLLRRLKLEACRRPGLADLRDAFWPDPPRAARFEPEPGCSEPTFTGSDSDLAGLSARMLNAIAKELARPGGPRMASGWFLETEGALESFHWPPDLLLGRPGDRYQVRVSPAAQREMCAWARRSRRVDGPGLETGGLLFGEVSEAAGVVWVTEVEGPPPDSHASARHFTCGVAGMANANAEKSRRFRRSVACVGSWHTHPDSPGSPSDVDLLGVGQILADSTVNRRICVALILSGDPDAPSLGAHVFRAHSRGEYRLEAEHATADEAPLLVDRERQRDVGLALSGGGSRAIAFHLGCLRALHDLDLLARVRVISSVSGGSVIGALYAYRDEPFESFDDRVVAMLRRGLVRDIATEFLRPRSLALSGYTLLVHAAGSVLRAVQSILPRRWRNATLGLVAIALGRRRSSRTEAFCQALARLLGDRKVCDVARPGLDVVLNATELRTGSAFRFGSRESGCWRFGRISQSDAIVAEAVAASAAYPLLLPALDRTYRFRAGEWQKEDRVVLTDGGVFENLGVSCMEPGRSSEVSTNVFRPDYVISCDAGSGLLDGDGFPLWWPKRMERSFLTTFRKVQDATRNRLHRFSESGAISGFVLSYLGQDDGHLPWLPPELPRRTEVYKYPTDFSPMDEQDIDRLSLRGELLTRLLVAYYLPNA